MFASVRLPRLLGAVSVVCLLSGVGFTGLIGSAGRVGSGMPGASLALAQSSPAAEAGPTPRQETDAALQLLKERADYDQTATSDPRSTETMPLATELDAAAETMREHLKKMRQLAIKYHLSDTPAEIKSLRAQWIHMLETGRKHHQTMIDAALADYRANPKPDSETAELLFQIAARNADSDRYDGMLEVVKVLEESGFTSQQFDLCVGLTAAAHNEFELARPHLQIAMKNLEVAIEKLAKDTSVPDEERQKSLKKMADTHGLLGELSDVDMYRPLWAEEQERRQADASGEPLPRVRIETTKGAVEVELFEDQAPNTVANFISLCEQNFYDGLPFHRVLTHFMAQGGCPNRDGTGGPGYTIRTELGPDHRNFFRGTLGLALAAQPDSGGSQFFICYMPRAFLNGKYVAFGRVIEGMDVLSDLTHIDPEDKDKGEHAAAPPDEITSTKVLRKRNHPYQPEKMQQAK